MLNLRPWLLRGIPFAAIALAGIVLVLSTGAFRLEARHTQAQSASGDALLLELAERLLSNVYGSTGAERVQLFPGTFAPDFPSEVPLPPDSTLIGSDERPSLAPPHGPPPGYPLAGMAQQAVTAVHIDVLVDTAGSRDDLIDFYDRVMSGLGWSPAATVSFTQGGFISSASPTRPVTFCRSDGASLSLILLPSQSALTDLRLSFDTGFSAMAACRPPAILVSPTVPPVPTAPPVPALVLPPLQPPSGATVRANGNFGSGSRFSTDSLAITDLSPGDLHAVYASQLAGSGWKEIDSGADGALAWSTWSVPDHADLQGFLYVRDGPAAGQLSLHAEIASTDPNAQFAGSVYNYGPPGAGPVFVPAASTPTPAPGH